MVLRSFLGGIACQWWPLIGSLRLGLVPCVAPTQATNCRSDPPRGKSKLSPSAEGRKDGVPFGPVSRLVAIGGSRCQGRVGPATCAKWAKRGRLARRAARLLDRQPSRLDGFSIKPVPFYRTTRRGGLGSRICTGFSPALAKGSPSPIPAIVVCNLLPHVGVPADQAEPAPDCSSSVATVVATSSAGNASSFSSRATAFGESSCWSTEMCSCRG